VFQSLEVTEELPVADDAYLYEVSIVEFLPELYISAAQMRINERSQQEFNALVQDLRTV
jgi:hypothetical protein